VGGRPWPPIVLAGTEARPTKIFSLCRAGTARRFLPLDIIVWPLNDGRFTSPYTKLLSYK